MVYIFILIRGDVSVLYDFQNLEVYFVYKDGKIGKNVRERFVGKDFVVLVVVRSDCMFLFCIVGIFLLN